MCAFTFCNSTGYLSAGMSSPTSSCLRFKYSAASCRTASMANAPEPRAGSQMVNWRISSGVVRWSS
ncbi:Uncharacterised protein [Mycobacteroides abscessus subsp. abscessus]|nr:Uncharacterised protein [Mycobacteroides abscessus subsp. abscessus]